MSLTVLSRSGAFLRDGAYVTDPVLADGAATYTPGVSERRGVATTFLHSGLKNADAQSGTAQTVAATRQYDAFGNFLSSTGTWNGPFGYGGGFGYQEDATGLKLLGHRYYDSSTGRFLTRDPNREGRNWFTYAHNNPVNFYDPTGLGVYEWIYTGDWNASSDVYDAALDAAATQLIGRDETDPDGYPVRVGGPVNWVNPSGNAITPDGTTYINPEDEDRYWNNQWWRDHEHRHVHQRLEIADELVDNGFHHGPMPEWKKTVFFLIAILQDYIEAGSHDGAGLEQDANNWADNLQLWRSL